MNAKTMEGLTGASASIHMVSTPMSIAKEAERKGDTEKMKRALGYAAGLVDQADQYSEKTSEGMKLDAKEAREQEALRQKELTEARKKEREEQEKQIREGGVKQEGPDFDSAEISREGKIQSETTGLPSPVSPNSSQNMGYDKSGETAELAAETGAALNVSA
jgi:hypothetical protein